MSAISIKQEAILIATDILERAQNLKPELQKIELRAKEIQARLHSADVCQQRCLDFQPLLDGNFQCPSCWVRNGAKAVLFPVDSQTDLDNFRCRVCSCTVSVEP